MILPPERARIVVAMSGGVDSSVAAACLKKQGYDVIGVSLQLHDASERVENKYGTCCTLGDIQDARRVAERIGIPFYVSDMEVEFQSAVIDDFVNEYLSGRTPNPCVRCNEKVKFSRLLEWSIELGADYLATGHYARIQGGPNGYELHKAISHEKDQSYFLFATRSDDLARCIFPVGALSKKEVRAMASDFGLGVANKPDSQEICFVQGTTYQEFIKGKVPESLRRPGQIVDVQGRELGRHSGLYQFTIGQRKGLGFSSQRPLFVIDIDPTDNRVVVGEEGALFKSALRAGNVSWINGAPGKDAELTAKVRSRGSEISCSIEPLGGDAYEVRFSNPQRAVTPGQAIVFYENTRVVGGGWII